MCGISDRFSGAFIYYYITVDFAPYGPKICLNSRGFNAVTAITPLSLYLQYLFSSFTAQYVSMCVCCFIIHCYKGVPVCAKISVRCSKISFQNQNLADLYAASQYYVRRCGLLLQTEYIVCLSRSCALQNSLNRSRCRLGCGLTWMGQGSMYYMGVHIVATWRIRLNRPLRRRCGRFVKIIVTTCCAFSPQQVIQ